MNMSLRVQCIILLLCVTFWSCMSAGEVTLVNRNVTDSFRVGKDGCTGNNDCSSSGSGLATCQSDSGLCFCSDVQPNFLYYTTMSGSVYECVTSRSIRYGIGGYISCVLGPFQLIPYSPDEQSTKFADQQDPTKALKSCSLQEAVVTFPDNVTEIELQWLDDSYVALAVSNNKTLHFKWKKSVPGLRGAIITLSFRCQMTSYSSYSPCLRAKVFGTWSADKVSVPTNTTVTSTRPNTSKRTSKTTSAVQITKVTTEKPESIANATSTEDCSDCQLLNKIFFALFSVSFIINIVLIIYTRIYLRKSRRRMQGKNMKMKEIPNADQQRKSRTGGDIETYDEVVSRSGTRNDEFQIQPFPTSANDKNKGRLSEHNYEEPASYEPLRRKALQDQDNEHRYQSLK